MSLSFFSFILTPQLNSEYWIRFWMNAIASLERNAEKTRKKLIEQGKKMIREIHNKFPMLFSKFYSLFSPLLCYDFFFFLCFRSLVWLDDSFCLLFDWHEIVCTRAHIHMQMNEVRISCVPLNSEFIGVDFFFITFSTRHRILKLNSYDRTIAMMENWSLLFNQIGKLLTLFRTHFSILCIDDVK